VIEAINNQYFPLGRRLPSQAWSITAIFGRHQIILLGDRGTWVWTAGSKSLCSTPRPDLAPPCHYTWHSLQPARTLAKK